MILGYSPVSTAILFSWLLHFIIALVLKNQNKFTQSYYQSLWKTLGYLGLVLMGLAIWRIIESIILGIFFDLFVFYHRVFGIRLWWPFLLDLFFPLLFCFDLNLRFRNSNKLRSFQLAAIVAIMLTRLVWGNDFEIVYHRNLYIINPDIIIEFMLIPLTIAIAGLLILWVNTRIAKTIG